MSSERNWREAKPKWVVDAAEAEMAGMRRKLALRWPTEAKPKPVGFQFGAYDGLSGKVIEGTYYSLGAYQSPDKVEIRAKTDEEIGWKRWRFRVNDGEWTDHVYRGPLFPTKRDAALTMLWSECEAAAGKLERAWDVFEGADEIGGPHE